MRLFVAAVPPPEIVEDLDAFLEPRRAVADAPRWTDPEQWHVTLAFMGAVPDRRLDGLVERLSQRSPRWPRLRLAVTGGTAYPNPYAARVLVARLSEPSRPEDAQSPVVGLARAVRHACSAGGAEPDGARFRPHLTLGRFRTPGEATRWVRVLETYAGPPFEVTEVVLFASHLGQGRGGRPRHEVVGTFPLGRGTQ